MSERRTVADMLEALDRRGEWTSSRPGFSEDDVERALKATRIERYVALSYPPNTPLMTVGEAMMSPDVSPKHKWLIQWQRPQDFNLSSSEEAFMAFITVLDDRGLDKLAKGWPMQVEAIREWRTTDLATRMRGMPFDFSL